uniref:probable mitochondrial-processing peptidase subunit beta, mitochondrial n=1 Tax=Erigeron canadensis TaxID=72917 RepID=UPI001CB8AEB3|nr:probable mitochondrial-processing peptidase subunit beta, mitochondrial [Erigeron canadensis]
MAIRHLLTLSRHSHRPIRSYSTATATALTGASEPRVPPSPPHPNEMIYDRISEQVKSKLKKLENPNPKFLKHNSPYPVTTDHTSILKSPETRVTTLPNGLRVATSANGENKTATVGVWIDSGARFEAEGANGVANFVEHLAKKGVRSIGEEIENMGGCLDGSTGREQTSFYVKCMGSDVNKGVGILSEILQNSRLDDRVIDQERSEILRQIGKANEQSDDVIFNHLHATAFQYTPLGRTVLGPAENIKKITKKDIEDYASTNYAAHRVVISASGAVKHEDVVEQVKKTFTKLSANPMTTSQLVEKEPAIFTGSEIRMRDDDAPLARFAVAFNGASWTDPDSLALMVIQAMLGTWNASTLAGKHSGSQLVQMAAISELAETMMAFNMNYKDTGLFGVYAVAKADCLDDLAFAIMQEMTKLCYRVGDDDVTRALNKLKSSLLLHLDGTTATADDIGRQLLSYGRRIPFAELFARIDAINAATIKRVANRFIFDQDIAIAASGPVKLLPDYNWFRRRTYMLRY